MPDPDRWHAMEQRRRKLAERLGRVLAHPNPDDRPGTLGDVVAGAAVRVRWPSAIDAHIAFDQAPSLIGMGAQYQRFAGRGGVVLVIHCIADSMDDWSLVVPFEPFTAPVLVCLDDMDGQCLAVYDDSPEARDALSTLHVRLLRAFGDRQAAIDAGTLPPDA
ncbi:hypothetical protein AB0M46_19750 [Dactylosporangium sp. NPDC051485]|uniref:hypothetical protein n=1 Tax=Dactylosporangium sp. NPDC051485 TaxID=3154846 RepID=UPI0034337F65